jgi:V/A-type H+/Na+-transporting ATPase subunit E
MAVEDILKRIEADAEEEAGRILAEGRKEAEKVRSEAASRADARRKELEAAAKRRADEERNRITTLARLAARRELLDAKRALIDSVFEEAANRIVKMPKDKYRAFIEGLLEESVESGDEEVLIGEGEERIDQSFLDEVSKRLKKGKGLKLSDERRPIRAGFVLRSGRVETNCALSTILRGARERVETEVAAALFEEDKRGG